MISPGSQCCSWLNNCSTHKKMRKPIIIELDISHLVIEDDIPVDNFQSEVQQRLLVEPV